MKQRFLCSKKHGPGGVFTIPERKSTEAAKHCTECGAPFSLFKSKYNCYACGVVVCNRCSDHRRHLPKFGYTGPVRCCDTCDTLIQMQQMNSSALSELPLKSLKKYLEAYNLSSAAAIEKSDLVRIILNTRPISNESEIYYRSHRKPAPPTTAEEASSISRVFNEISDMIAGSIDKQEQKQQERQQQQQQQQDTYRQQQQEAYRHQQQQQQRQQQRQQEAFYRQQQQQQRQQQEAYAREQQMRREQHQAMLRQQRQQQEAYRRQQQQQQQQQAGPPPSSNYPPPPHTTFRSPPNPPRPQPSPPAMRSDNFLSLDDMIQSKVDPASLSVRTLKAILKANFVEHAHVLEKSDLVSRVQRLADERKKELAARNNTSSSSGVDDATLCRICFDAQQNCVYLDCGHMVSCMDCGKQLVSTKNECPICREPILKLVHVFRS